MLRSGRRLRRSAAARVVVPTGQVDSMMTRSPRFSTGAMEESALSTMLTSAVLSSRIGVGTAIRNASAGSGFVTARRLPEVTTARITMSRSGSAKWA